VSVEGDLTAVAPAAPPLTVGLVNLMSDAALQVTERQFRAVFAVASPRRPVLLRLFTLPEVARTRAGLSHLARHYERIEALWTSRLDGLIVTGAEPVTQRLQDEPYWPSLTRLADWAAANTASTIWSCLSAHAVALYLDGLARVPVGQKISGLYECQAIAPDPLLDGLPARWRWPHSRYNGLAEEALASHGYRILSRAGSAGADIFVKPHGSLFVFHQGHPEYDPGALVREYRRDVRRYILGERDTYPPLPEAVFDERYAAHFAALRDRAERDRAAVSPDDFPTIPAARLAHGWREPAGRLYANWLGLLARSRSGAAARQGAGPASVPV
jgi:homoserine O-succinyltransferase